MKYFNRDLDSPTSPGTYYGYKIGEPRSILTPPSGPPSRAQNHGGSFHGMSFNKSSIVGGASQKGGVLKPTLHDYTAITPHAVTKIPIILDPNHHSTFTSSVESHNARGKRNNSKQKF
jgi:hypothetical protein